MDKDSFIEIHEEGSEDPKKKRASKNSSIEPTVLSDEEERSENSLRPKWLSEYVGQTKVKSNLLMFIEAAKKRSEALDHCLFAGPPGLGKTTLAHIISHELNSKLHIVSAPALEKKGDLAALLTNLEENDVLFIDEIHRLNSTVEEILYSAMEDYCLDIILGQGPSAKSIRIDLPPFTLIGATTRAGSLTHPLRDRFGVVSRLNFYEADELKEIVTRSAKKLSVRITADGAGELAKRSRGTPRIANRLLRRVRDYAEVRANGIIDGSVAKDALDILEVDHLGLDEMDRRILEFLMESGPTRPVGIDTISAALGEERVTIEDVYEPFLLQQGLLQRTPRGRIATDKTYQHFAKPLPGSSEIHSSGLFQDS